MWHSTSYPIWKMLFPKCFGLYFQYTIRILFQIRHLPNVCVKSWLRPWSCDILAKEWRKDWWDSKGEVRALKWKVMSTACIPTKDGSSKQIGHSTVNRIHCRETKVWWMAVCQFGRNLNISAQRGTLRDLSLYVFIFVAFEYPCCLEQTLSQLLPRPKSGNG